MPAVWPFDVSAALRRIVDLAGPNPGPEAQQAKDKAVACWSTHKVINPLYVGEHCQHVRNALDNAENSQWNACIDALTHAGGGH